MGESYEYVGTELSVFAQAVRWKAYLRHELRAFLKGVVLEVGAGVGSTTRALYPNSARRWTCLEPDSKLALELDARLAPFKASNDLDLSVIVGTTKDLSEAACYDTILYVDVLEHIVDAHSEIERAKSLLRAGGFLIVVAPAHDWLFSPFDKQIGHVRRYDVDSLTSEIPSGLARVRLRYLDSVGIMASLANRVFLKSRMPTTGQIRAWDRIMVPCSRLFDPLLGYRMGKTILGVWRRQDGESDRLRLNSAAYSRRRSS